MIRTVIQRIIQLKIQGIIGGGDDDDITDEKVMIKMIV